MERLFVKMFISVYRLQVVFTLKIVLVYIFVIIFSSEEHV